MECNARNRGIKNRGSTRPKITMQIYVNGLKIIIGQLGIVELTNRKTGRKNVNKLISTPFLSKISIMVC